MPEVIQLSHNEAINAASGESNVVHKFTAHNRLKEKIDGRTQTLVIVKRESDGKHFGATWTHFDEISEDPTGFGFGADYKRGWDDKFLVNFHEVEAVPNTFTHWDEPIFKLVE
jgi:hypothetical protein